MICIILFCHYKYYCNLFGASLLIVSILLGYTSYKLKETIKKQNVLYQFENLDIQIYGTLIEKPKKINWYKTLLKIDSIDYENQIWHTHSKVMLFIEPKIDINEIKLGTEVHIQASIYEIDQDTNPDAFDYKRFLFHKDIHHYAYVKAAGLQVCNHKNSKNIFTYFKEQQLYAVSIIEKYFAHKDNSGIASALAFGYKEDINDELNQLYRHNGAAHILAVSGLHVGIIASIILFMIGAISKIIVVPKWMKIVLLALIMTIYALFTGCSSSVLRASCMTVIGYGIYLYRSVNFIYNSLGLTSLILLIYNPFIFYDIGFQLSFLAVLSIIFFTKPISKLVRADNIVLRNFAQIIIVSCTVQILIAPLSIYYFNQYSLGFILTNITSIITAYLIIILSFMTYIFDGYCGNLSEIFATCANKILSTNHNYLHWVENNFQLLLDQLYFNKIGLILIYTSILLSMLWIYRFTYYKLILWIVGVLFTLIIFKSDYKETIHEKSIVFYDVKDQYHIDFIYDQICYTIQSDRSLVDKKYFVKNRTAHFVSKVIPLTLEDNYCDQYLIKDGPFIQFGNKIIGIYPDQNIQTKMKIDYLYVDQYCTWPLPQNPPTLLITNENYKCVEKLDIETHNIGLNGSLLLQI